MTVEIKDENILAAFRDTMGEEVRSFVELFKERSPQFYRAFVSWADGGAMLKGDRGTRPYIEEMSAFVQAFNLTMAIFYHARGGRLPTIDDNFISQVMEDEGTREDFTERALKILSAQHPFLGEFLHGIGQDLGDFSRFSLLLATTIVSKAVEEDAKDHPGRGPLLEYMEQVSQAKD